MIMPYTKIDFDFVSGLPRWRPHASAEEAELHSMDMAALAALLVVARIPQLWQDPDNEEEIWCDAADVEALPPLLRRLHWVRKRGTTKCRVELQDLLDLLEPMVCQIADAPPSDDVPEQRKTPDLRLV